MEYLKNKLKILIDDLKIEEVLKEKVLIKKTPILGICLGAQLMLCKSQEGQRKGLSFIDGECVKFDKSKIGNNKIHILKDNKVDTLITNQAY